MSFLDDIVDLGSSVVDFVTGPGIGSQIAQTALTAYTVSQLNNSINPDNNKAVDPATGDTTANTNKDYGVREQVDPDTNNAIPVVYGNAFLGGKIVDAVLSADKTTMYYCMVICEKTGTKFSDGQPSVISFAAIYWNQLRMVFRNDGASLAKFVSEDGDEDTKVDGLVAVALYSGGSNFPVKLEGYNDYITDPAYNIMPNWTTNHTMDNLVFAIFGVTYSKTANLTGLGKIEFHMKNTMKQPGDCIYDYMTNTRYGAGIPPEEINQ